MHCEIDIYNWKELDAKYKLGAKSNAELLFGLLEKKGISKLKELLEEIDGVYAFAYRAGDEIFLCRDILGIKPLWYSTKNGLAFASERKELLKTGLSPDDILELDPRRILVYDMKKNGIKFIHREFFKIVPEHKKSHDKILQEGIGLIVNSVAKRLPDEKFGILFSGGVDSVLLAKICKDLGADFVCYTSALDSEKEAEDLAVAKKAANQMGLTLRTKTIKLDEVEAYLKKIVPMIETSSVVHAGVGLTIYVACELARQDGIKVMLSGLGSEELFAGYERHRMAAEVNKECLTGLLAVHNADTYRDNSIAKNLSMDIRAPFLDTRLAEYAMKIPAKYKFDGKESKKILREAAERLGVPGEFAWRKKRAAQYGSRFDNALERLSAKAGIKSKSAYLDRFYHDKPVLGVLFSSGKDSCYAMWKMMQQKYPIRCLITIRSANPDSYMFHTPNIDMAEMQALAMNKPILIHETAGEKELELADLKKALEKAKKQYGIEGVVTGALYSQYQKERIENVCKPLGLKVLSPLWHMDQAEEMRQILDAGFEIILSSVAAEGLDKSWLGRSITAKDIDKLVAINKKLGINVAGEGGEFESLALDGPIFNRRIVIEDSEIISESKNTARFVVKKAKLVNKNN
jgi:asparagine synthase (glutamine-hydrolysing)